MSLGSRRRVNYSQLEALWEILNENRSLATGYNKTSQARELSRRMWETVAESLNSFGDGATKDWKAWCKYWNDYKSKLKSRVAGVRASHQRTGGGPSNVQPLAEIEKKFLQILGDDFGSGIPEARVEPFDEAPPADQPLGSSQQGSESVLIHWAPPDPSIDVFTEHRVATPTPPPVSPPIMAVTPRRSPRILLRHDSPSAAQAQPPQRTPRRHSPPRPSPPRPARQRQRRGEPPMSQQAARRALVADSQERIRLSREKLILLRNLVQELKELKNIIISRLPLPATVD